MKSCPEMLDEQIRQHDASSGNHEIDELVAFALDWKRSSQPDPKFAERLEQRVRMHAVQHRAQRQPRWAMPLLWMRFVIAALLCLVITTGTIFAIANPVDLWQQHGVIETPTPLPRYTATPVPYHQHSASSGKSVDSKGSNAEQSNSVASPGPAMKNTAGDVSLSPTVVSVTSTPTPTPALTPTATSAASLVCVLKICL